MRVSGFPAQTAPTREAAEKIELELKRRRALGDLYEAPAITLGEAIDGTLARIEATREPSEKTRAYNAPLREVLGAAARHAACRRSGARRSRTWSSSGRRSIRGRRRTSSSSSSGCSTTRRAAASESTRRSSRSRRSGIGRGRDAALTVTRAPRTRVVVPRARFAARPDRRAGRLSAKRLVQPDGRDARPEGGDADDSGVRSRSAGASIAIYLTDLEVGLLREQLLVARARDTCSSSRRVEGKQVDGKPRSGIASGCARSRRRSTNDPEPARRRLVRVRRASRSTCCGTRLRR